MSAEDRAASPDPFGLALAFHRAGAFDEAETAYRNILLRDAAHSAALTNLATIQLQRNRPETGVQLLALSLQIDPGQPNAHNLRACGLKELGRLEEAIDCCDQAIRLQPDYADAFSNRADALFGLQRLEEAVADYDRAIALGQEYAETFYNRANALSVLGRLEEALDSFNRAIALRPGLAQAFVNRGAVLKRLGRPEEALADHERAAVLWPDRAEVFLHRGDALLELKRPEAALADYDRAIALNPDYAEAFGGRGIALCSLGRPAEGLASFERAIALKPDHAEAFNNRGNALLDLGWTDRAVASYEQAIALQPDYAEAFHNRGNAFLKSKRLKEAIASYDRAVASKPDYAAAYRNRGTALYYCGRQDDALADFGRALALDPDDAETRWSLALARIPAVFAAGQDVQRVRAEFAAELDALDRWFDEDRIAQGIEAVGNPSPFYLAYQAFDNRPLMARCGALCRRLTAYWQDRQGYRCDAAAPDGRLRIGIVSNHVADHSVWRALVKGWMRHFDRSRFELHVFHTAKGRDAETAFAQSLAEHFIEGHTTLAQWAEAILAQRIDALIYPEIGMDPTTARLASLRLAPLQLAAWGHPETTGLPTVDHYLSAADFEPEGAEAFYTERLVRLPRLGCCYSRLEVADAEPDWARLDVRADEPVLLCAGTPYKYAPEYDRVLVEIARRLGRCRMVFFASRNERPLAERLRERLTRVFDDAGLDFGRFGVLAPWLDKPAFHGLLRRADALLDTIGFSGFNTAMQAVECAAPIVTMEGRFMRGRFASGILKRMNLPELVASGEEEYIALAVRLARDAEYRQAVRQRIGQARDALFDDTEPVRALEDFLEAQLQSSDR